MDMNTETTATKPAGFPKTDAPQAFREMAEKDTTQTKETYEKMNAASWQGCSSQAMGFPANGKKPMTIRTGTTIG
jgi:hypothetical protein